MTTPVSREELTARLETVEAHAAARQNAIDGKLDRVLDQIANLATQVGEAKAAADQAKAATTLTRWNLVFLVVGLFAAVVALVGLLSTLVGNITDLIQIGVASKG